MDPQNENKTDIDDVPDSDDGADNDFQNLLGSRQYRILLIGLDAAGLFD
jgi:hypothetical protein